MATKRRPVPIRESEPTMRKTRLEGRARVLFAKMKTREPVVLATKDMALAVPRKRPRSSSGERCWRRDWSGTI